MKKLWKVKFRSLVGALENPDRGATAALIFNRMNLGWSIQISKVSRADIKLERALFSQESSRGIYVASEGYYKRESPVSGEKLSKYYRDTYWAIRGGKRNGVNERDVTHFQLLLDHLPKVIRRGNTALNFGAGHGGISHLFWAAGMNVVNIEPSGLFNPYKQRFSVVDSLQDLPDASVDIIYGCHSLEHVSDIEEIRVLIESKLKRPGWMFWQTPNAELLRASQKEGLEMPSNKNYLFEARFFNQWMDNVLFNEVAPDAQGKDLQAKPLRRVLGSVFPTD